jgi:hypothetical protein
MIVSKNVYIKDFKEVSSTKDGKTNNYMFMTIIDDSLSQCELFVDKKFDKANLPQNLDKFLIDNRKDYLREIVINLSEKGNASIKAVKNVH